jgi:hypothetical protein
MQPAACRSSSAEDATELIWHTTMPAGVWEALGSRCEYHSQAVRLASRRSAGKDLIDPLSRADGVDPPGGGSRRVVQTPGHSPPPAGQAPSALSSAR